MSLTPLNYASSDSVPTRRQWPPIAIGIVVAILCLLLGARIVTVRKVEHRMDSVTGSIASQTYGPFGIESGPPRVHVSLLEQRLKESGISWVPSWHQLSSTHYNVFDRPARFGCGRAPPILHLRDVEAAFAGPSTDDELREFVRVMESGNDAQQKAAVDAAVEKALAALAAARAARMHE